MTYPVRAAEHVKYEYFILDMMIDRDTLLHIVYLNFRIIVSQLCYDDPQMNWIIVNIWVKYVYLMSPSCLKNIMCFLNNKIDILQSL